MSAGIVQHRASGWRHAANVLAILALFLNILIPPGFMVKPAGAAPTTIVICTGNGPVIGYTTSGEPQQTSEHDTLCVFAGHAAAGPPPALESPVAIAYVMTRTAGPTAAEELIPGRGLAAPPPPAHAPPSAV